MTTELYGIEFTGLYDIRNYAGILIFYLFHEINPNCGDHIYEIKEPGRIKGPIDTLKR